MCHIQIVPKDDFPKTKKIPASEVEEHHVVMEEENDDGYVVIEREPPLLVFADYESVTDRDGVQTPILLGYETNESDECHLLYGPDCTADFFRAMEDLAVDSEGVDRNVIIFFHNLKGYDGMFLLKH